MAITKPEKVPKKNITSIDITGWSGGLFLNGEQMAEGNQFVSSKNAELSPNGKPKPRKSLQKWLPDTVETVYEVFPALWNGQLYFFTADENKLKYCQEGDLSWTDCTGSNTITTNNGGKTTFLRVLNSILVLNGSNGDRLCYIDLETVGFDVVKYTFVANPASAVSISPTVLTNSGSYKIYYGWTYSSATGETEISPILTYTINKPRDQWNPDGTEFLTITRPGVAPAGATYWNLYVAPAANGGTIQPTDMLMLAGGLDLNQASIVDNGTLAIDIGRGNPPSANSTEGPRVDHGIETNGRPVLFGDVDERDNVWIGGDGEFARDFSSSNGGFRSQPSKGTNYYPASVVGFRNGQGIPSLTILFSNTQGLSKQATLEQQTINYGKQSFVVWGVTEQNYGAAGVASSYGVINYKGQLSFPSTDGMMSMDTQPQLQNVLATKDIDKNIKEYMRRVNVGALQEIVGTAWNNRFLWIIPAYGFNTPTEILIRDLDNNGAWYTLQIASQWIGVVSPDSSPAFVYICQGNKILKLYDAFGTVDYIDGAATFETEVVGAKIGVNDAHNGYQAVVQAVFYMLDLIGDIYVGVNYTNQNGKPKNKEKLYHGPQYVASSSGGWSDPQYLYNGQPTPATWWQSVLINQTDSALVREDKRIPLNINDLASELQPYIRTPNGYSDYLWHSVSFEGENLGVKPDLR